jgi:ADP-ribosyl-[dinitrogen reductase] hydrolase
MEKRRMTEIKDKFRGSFLGLAVGDALGTSVEFMSPGTFEPVAGMRGGGVFKLKPGQWTDDTSLALCLAESLVECKEFNAEDQMKRYLRWYDHGYMSSTGSCFDIGSTTAHALNKFRETGNPFSGSIDRFRAGNGSIMRLAPVPLLYSAYPEKVVFYSGESSRTTHGSELAVDACRYMGAIIVGLANGSAKEEILSSLYSPVKGLWEKEPLCREISEVASGSFKKKNPPEIKGTGYVVESLEAALWAFYNSSSFEEGCLMAVNLGNDADTTGAVYGQIAGVYYGADAIPKKWLDVLAMRETIEDLADRLLKVTSQPL